MADGPDSFCGVPEQTTQEADEKQAKLVTETGNLKLPAKAAALPDQAALTKQQFPAATVEGATGTPYPIKPLGSILAPSKSLPDAHIGEIKSSQIQEKKSADLAPEKSGPKPKLTKIEIDKTIAELANTKTSFAALLKLGDAISAADGADVIKVLGESLENENPEISKAIARLLSDTYAGGLPSDPFNYSALEQRGVNYANGALPSSEDQKSRLFAYLSNPQNLEGELRKIAELKRIMGDESKFQKIKENRGVVWPETPYRDHNSGRTEKLDALFQLVKTRDLLVSMRANTPDEFLAKNLHLLKNQSSLDLKTFPVTISSLREIAKQRPNLEGLYIHNGQAVTDEGLAIISELKQLNTLQIDRSAITDQGLAALGQKRQVRHLFLGPTPAITNQGIANLIGSDITSLGLTANPQITNEAIPSLREIANKSGWLNINLIDTGISVEAMKNGGFDLSRTRISVSGGTPKVYWESKEPSHRNDLPRFPRIELQL